MISTSNKKYLFESHSEKSNEKEEIDNRIAKESRSAAALSKLLMAKYLARRLKLKLDETVLCPTLLYDGESWISTSN